MPVLPHSPLETSQIGVGCGSLTEGLSFQRDIRVIHAAFEAGARHFDVAPQYGWGTAEGLLGRALRDRRGQVTIVSKVGISRPEASRAFLMARALASPLRRLARDAGFAAAMPRRAAARDFSPARVEAGIGESLRHLQTDYLDALLLHMVTLPETSDALLELLHRRRKAGTIRAIGLATTKSETARILAAFPGQFDIVQYAWSALKPPPRRQDGDPFLITHGLLKDALRPLAAWLARDRDACARLSRATDTDLAERRRLAAVLIGAAVAANPDGIALVASQDTQRIRANIEAAQDERIVLAGRRLLRALACEGGPACP